MDQTDRSDNYHTWDGVKITPGLRVWSPYPYQWGNVDPDNWKYQGTTSPSGEYFDGWYRVKLDDDSSELLNGTRMATVDPSGQNPDPKLQEFASAEEREAAAAKFNSPGAPPF